MTYVTWLLIASVLFVLLERLRPARKEQGVVRPQLLNDLLYVGFNGHVFSLLTAGLVAWFATRTNGVLEAVSLLPERGWLSERPFWLQFVIFLLISDLLQWSVHNLLHRVPFLWNFHKVHHSIHRMDWAGAMRFHWMEIVVYRSLQYIPLLYLGGDPEPLLVVYVFGTFWGHFNHANLDLGIGPLAYVFNSPRMHLWHHDASDEGGTAKNFGIVLSLWDWLFGTAYWPRDRSPARIGYPGDEEIPRNWLAQLAFPLARRRES
jgi:sterol desaturase/sphingolipid hydroxylase (fatty acid hydroxylase superfamily)